MASPFGVMSGGLALIAVVAWSGHWNCPFALLVGEPCAGCGMTRALSLLGRGRLKESLALHPLALPACALGLVTLVIWSRTPHQDGPPLSARLRWAWYALVAAMVLLWMSRFVGWFGGPVPLDAGS